MSKGMVIYDAGVVLGDQIELSSKLAPLEKDNPYNWSFFGDPADGRVIAPGDPNDIEGPAGFGPQNFITNTGSDLYTINFQNEATATAPAQTVTVTQQLDPNLNWSTFRLVGFGFDQQTYALSGNQAFYSGVIDLSATKGYDIAVTAGVNLANGMVTWTFTTIDPTTGETPTNPLTGFLPVDDGTGIGDGFATYSIQANANVQSGTTISAQATVVFNNQPPLSTAEITNTIDASTPVSSVTALPAQTANTQFDVSWSGTDDPQSSGIASYTIMVSVNGAPATAWLTDTTLSNALFTGQDGNTYSFSSFATSNAGNVEAQHATPDTTIEIGTVAPTGLALTPASDSGVSQADDITNVAAPTVTGQADPSATVTLYDGTNVVGTGVADAATGAWSITTTQLADGVHDLTATAVNATGVVSPSSATLEVTFDTTPPTVTISLVAGAQNQADRVVSGTVSSAEPGATVTIYDGATAIGTAALQADDSWSASVTLSGQGVHALTAVDEDLAGNIGTSAAVDAVYQTVIDASVAKFLSNQSALDQNPGGFKIVDTAADVSSAFDALNADNVLGSIVLTDSGTPVLTLTVAQALNDTRALGEIANSAYAIAIVDTAANIGANLDALNASNIVSVTVADNAPVPLTAAQLTSDAAALAKLSNANGVAYALAVADPAANVTGVAPNIVEHGQTTKIAELASSLQNLPLVLTQTSGAPGSVALAANGAVLFTAPASIGASAVDAVSYSIADQRGDVVATGAASVEFDAGPTAANGALTIGHGQTHNITSLVDGLVTPGLTGDVETLTGVSATTGTISLVNGVATYIAPANGAGSISYTVADQLGDSATGSVAVTVDPGPNVSNGSLSIGYGQSQNISSLLSGLVTPGLAGDTLALSSVTATSGTIALANGLVSYTAPTSGMGVIAFTYVDQLGDSATGDIAVTTHTPNLTVAQTLALVSVTYPIAVADTAANVTANLNALNADALASITLTDAGTPTLTLSVAQALNDTAALGKIATPHTIALADTPADIAAISSAQASALKAAGYRTIAATGATTLTVAQAALLTGDSLAITGGPVSVAGSVAAMLALTAAQASNYITAGYKLAVQDAAAKIDALTTTQITSLSTLHVTQVSASDTTLALTVAQANASAGDHIALSAPAGSFVEVSDTATNLQALTAAQIGALAAVGVTELASSNGALKLTVAQLAALETGLMLAAATGASVTLSDTAANLQTLTAAEIAGLAAAGVSAVASTNASLVLNVAQALALIGAGVEPTVPSGDKVTISDTAANITALSAAQIATLPGVGVSSIAATGAGVVLSAAQALALETAAIGLTAPSGSSDSVSDIAANVDALTTTQIAGLAALHVTQISTTDVGAILSVAQAAALETAKIGLAAPTGASSAIVDTAADIETLTTTQITSLSTLHVTQVSASDRTLALTVAQATAFESAGVVISAPTGSFVEVSDTAAHLQALTAAQIAALPGMGASELYASSGNVSYTAAQTSAILAAGLTVAAAGSDTVTENFANGAYSTYEQGELTVEKSVNADGSYDIADFNILGQSYTSYENVYNSSGGHVAYAVDNSNGTGTLTLYGNGGAVSVGSGQLSVTAGADAFALNAHATETITATGTTGDTFAFAPNFGTDAITSFVATGATHDLLQFNASAFGAGLTAANQSADWQALLSHTTNNSAGAAVITDIYGDSLTLTGVSKTTISSAANAADFKFV